MQIRLPEPISDQDQEIPRFSGTRCIVQPVRTFKSLPFSTPMNTDTDQLEGRRFKANPLGKTSSKPEKAAPVDPPETHKTWCKNYDEEWAAFLAESSLKKTHPGLGNTNPETLPRVWNCPP